MVIAVIASVVKKYQRFCFLALLLATTNSLAITYKDVEPLITKECASCHKGPYLDLRTFPFFSDIYLTQTELLVEMIRRTKLTDLKRMPPASFEALQPEEIGLLEQWLAAGVN